MLFNSYEFVLAFLPMALLGYFLLNSLKKYSVAKIYLLGMSLYFYAYFNNKYLVIIILSIIINFSFSLLFRNEILSCKIKKIVLIIAVCCNLGSIFYFKYYDFFIGNINKLLETNISLLKLLLPLGISFFTFQQISFLMDSYKEELRCNFFDYALFVTFFPQLIAGPIVTHDEIMPQFASLENKKINYQNFSKGMMSFSFGLAKKVLVADFCGNIANWGFLNYAGLDTTNAILVAFSYTIQIYFDFSGYCDMATGIGYMFNIIMPMNFNSPYKATTISDFWKRWHMTLTRFLTAYVYIPLGGNKKGLHRTCINIFIVYIVSGLWHGANWTFILWGVLHGVACILNRVFRVYIEKIHPALLWLMTFSFVNITWIYFRANSVFEANQIIKSIFLFNFGEISNDILNMYNPSIIQFLSNIMGHGSISVSTAQSMTVGFFCLTLVVIVVGGKNTNERISCFKPTVFVGIQTITLFILSVLSLSNVGTFLYFNF